MMKKYYTSKYNKNNIIEKVLNNLLKRKKN